MSDDRVDELTRRLETIAEFIDDALITTDLHGHLTAHPRYLQRQ